MYKFFIKQEYNFFIERESHYDKKTNVI